ncbi:hypothetical protein [Leifsonia sp. EB34]|uniref:hypothetical protein n=1 Tax=Leifsonia sp. EB34 TaxID=3156303 RepID=UPI003519A098
MRHRLAIRVRKRMPLLIGMAAALAIGLSACAWGGKEVNTETNLANQRKAAIAFLETQGGVEEIRFTEEGGPAGFEAPWGVHAVVTVDGQEFSEILGISRYSRIGNPLPTIAPGTAPAPVTVIYSDGASEVIE